MFRRDYQAHLYNILKTLCVCVSISLVNIFFPPPQQFFFQILDTEKKEHLTVDEIQTLMTEEGTLRIFLLILKYKISIA